MTNNSHFQCTHVNIELPNRKNEARDIASIPYVTIYDADKLESLDWLIQHYDETCLNEPYGPEVVEAAFESAIVSDTNYTWRQVFTNPETFKPVAEFELTDDYGTNMIAVKLDDAGIKLLQDFLKHPLSFPVMAIVNDGREVEASQGNLHVRFIAASLVSARMSMDAGDYQRAIDTLNIVSRLIQDPDINKQLMQSEYKELVDQIQYLYAITPIHMEMEQLKQNVDKWNMQIDVLSGRYMSLQKTLEQIHKQEMERVNALKRNVYDKEVEKQLAQKTNKSMGYKPHQMEPTHD